MLKLRRAQLGIALNVHLFLSFRKRAKTLGGSKFVVASDAVKRALDEKTEIAADDWHDETIRRTAVFTSRGHFR